MNATLRMSTLTVAATVAMLLGVESTGVTQPEEFHAVFDDGPYSYLPESVGPEVTAEMTFTTSAPADVRIADLSLDGTYRSATDDIRSGL